MTGAAPAGAGGSWPRVAFAVLAALAAALLVWLTRHQTFIQDEWAFLQYRYSGGIPSLLRAHNSHVMVLPLLIYKILFHTVGLHARWPYALTLVVAHVAVVTGVFVLVRRRIGDAAALAVVAPLLLLGRLGGPAVARLAELRPRDARCRRRVARPRPA